MAQTILNGPIRKVIMIKLKFEDLRFFLLPGQLGLTLKKFFEIFRNKFLTIKFLTCPIRKVIMLKVGFEDLQNCSPLPGHPESTFKILQKKSLNGSICKVIMLELILVTLISKLFLFPNSFSQLILICFFMILYILIDWNGI